jgi:isovaleryl-CoA dehydrogenase
MMQKFARINNKAYIRKVRLLSGKASSPNSIFNPTPEHKALREMVRSFVESEVDPQALEFNKEEKFNTHLFQKCGELGLLGITVPTEFGGSGMDTTAAVIVHEELAASDPAFCLSYLAHSMLFVRTFHFF